MRILVIGGTNFMGPYIIKNLSTAGHEVSIFHRGQTRAELPEGVKEILGDRDHLLDYASDLQKLEPEVVLHMVVWHEQHARDLMQTFAGVARRVVVVSSQDVYQAFGRVNRHEDGEIDPSPITENSPLRTKLYPYRGETLRAEDDPQRWMDDYDKIPAEHVIMNHPKLSGTILRLPAVYGPHDPQHRMFPYLKRMLDGREAILLEEGEANWRWTHGYVENVADAIALAVTDKRAGGRIYNIGEPFALSVVERVEQIAKAANWHGRIVIQPAERVPERLRLGINAAQDIVADTTHIRQELGYSERIDLAEAFQRTIAWERDHFPEKIDPERFDYVAEDRALAESMQ
ncbi:MAG: NAD-dependent epimerase/dehydratase family protein [Chloroflexota bacterium]|nr:NAD-dependent epimerase/dehydratase family protein [Chloroflexota bacterium]